ncbi:hypothetical protein E4T56_gene4141 [Termitomyces sp. T112]|nr:hypothetical protein E4T56_gene4141 [Termitomyces sp. T112]
MALQLFDLPLELILRVLGFLDLSELTVLMRTHSTFRQSIQDSQGFQYRFAAIRAGVESNVHSNHTTWERLALLKIREKSWLHMEVDFQKSIPNVKFPSGIYDLTGGIYFRGDLSRRSIHYCPLPSKSTDPISWRRIRVDRALVDIGVSVYEHNLIAILTYSPHPTIARKNIIEIVLLELSTGKPHPMAKKPVLFIGETSASKPAILLEVVGEYLVLVMTRESRELNAPSTLRVYEWITGTLNMDIQRPNSPYHNFIFLSPTVILLPNTQLNTLDVWEIPTGAKPPPTEPFLCLALPSLSYRSTIFHFSCRCEPNLTPSGKPYSEAPFHPDPEDAIIVLTAQVDFGAYALFVHRSALLRVCTTHQPEDEAGVSHYLPSMFTIGRIPAERVRAWDDWGPSITHVFNTSLSSLHWVTTTDGQRAIVNHVVDEDGENEEGQHSQLLDFNPSTVKRVVQAQADGSGGFDSHEVVFYTTVTIPGIESPITSQLPYVGVDIPFQDSWLNRFKGFLLYEEGLLVLLGGNDELEEQIEVLHVGVSFGLEEMTLSLGGDIPLS